MTTTLRTDSNGQPRKTLASQIDRLDGILDGLDAALAGAVQEAVGQAVKQAVQAVLTEVLTNHDLQEPLRQATTAAAAVEETSGPKSLPHRLWRSAAQWIQQMMQTVKKAGNRVGLAFLVAGGMVAGATYVTRLWLASAATVIYHGGKRLLAGALTTLTRVLPSFAFGGI